MYRLIIKPQVYLMLDEAYEWYEDQMIGLGERLLEEVDMRFDSLTQNPYYYSYSTDNFRQVVLRHFPYKIVYEIMDRDVVVYAVFHTSRNDINIEK